MITPLEIENKEFSKAMRGYNAEEVDAFLDQIILDLQQLLAEKEKLETEVEELKKDINQYKRSETSVLNTLESAMNDISESAEKRAEIIVRNAQMDAETIQREAKESVSRLTEEGDRLREKVRSFRGKYRRLIEEELSRLDGSSEELLAELEREFTPASMTDIEPSSDIQPKKEEKKEASAAPKRSVPKDTVVVREKSLEELLMEDFGVSSDEPDKTRVKEDLTKTRMI